ncbi:carbon storage regulator CsrA [Desulfoferrobacter suflitae]|uniref:carbon storage regulator CsrA n=1 Tax=Desulfoferrobacter suflitae TaxID=2865782 RepID=UPI0021646ADB|nr:carbon storage regulator CsrA [Desulfoferrobacter suflitae]MCK8602383.1 carbon storage regulator CsrA [Desulfoferrobacter suflitae]
MLVLTRKTGESIRIGDDIEIVITAVEQNKVRVGIRSPRHIPVHREELYRKMRQENRKAVCMSVSDIDRLSDLLQPKSSARDEVDDEKQGL